MSSSPVVSVRGQSTIEVEPEQAVVSLTASVQERTQAEAVRALSEQRAAVSEVLHEFAEQTESVDDGGVQIYPEFDAENVERIVRYVGRSTYTITVSEFSVLSELIVAATSVSLRVSGPWWQLRRDSEVYQQARLLAVGDAVRRAREYAGAFGAEVTELYELADRGLSTSGASAPQPGMMMRSAVAGGPGGNAPSFDLAPVRQHVTGEVEARFGMSAPDLDRPVRTS